MADNPYVNKVEYAGQIIMDLTNDTVTPSDVLNGVTFHDRSGAPQQGAVITHDVYDGLDSTSTDDALSAGQGKYLNDKINEFAKSVIVESSSKTNHILNIPTSGRYFVVGLGASSNNSFAIIVSTNSSGNVTFIELAKGSNVTSISVSDKNKLSITLSSNAGLIILSFSNGNTNISVVSSA